MSGAPRPLPEEVRRWRAAAYRAILDVGAGLGCRAYRLPLALSDPGEGWGLGYFAADYYRLKKAAGALIDRRSYHLASAASEAEYPFPQLRLCVNGTGMEAARTAELAMHQGIFINLHLLCRPALWPALERRAYQQLQERIRALAAGEGEPLEGPAGEDEAAEARAARRGARREEEWRRLLRKRELLMEEAAYRERAGAYYQIFPHNPEDFERARLDAEALEEATRPPEECAAADWSGYEFYVPEDLRI